MIESTTTLMANDVAVILRPVMLNGKWAGSFDVMVSGIGPITLEIAEMESMVGMGVLLASVVPLLEKDSELADKVMTHCNENYADIGEFSLEDDLGVDELTISTRCVGGLQ